MSELKELATIALRKRFWVWPEHEKAADCNQGTFDRPFMTYSTAKAWAELDDIIIVVPPKKELYRERYLKDNG